MMGKANHYGSRFAAQKAGAAFRQMAKPGGNSSDVLWYNMFTSFEGLIALHT